MAIAKSAGNTARMTSRSHHATARVRSAFGSTAKNCHSFRARRLCNNGRLRVMNVGSGPAYCFIAGLAVVAQAAAVGTSGVAGDCAFVYRRGAEPGLHAAAAAEKTGYRVAGNRAGGQGRVVAAAEVQAAAEGVGVAGDGAVGQRIRAAGADHPRLKPYAAPLFLLLVAFSSGDSDRCRSLCKVAIWVQRGANATGAAVGLAWFDRPT